MKPSVSYARANGEINKPSDHANQYFEGEKIADFPFISYTQL